MTASTLKFSLLGFIFQWPWLFKMFYGTRAKYAHLVVAQDTELVIEGYPRCANSFAVLAFEQAQGRKLKLAHHLHSQAQVLLALDYRVPVLVLIRDPISAAASLVTRHPEISPTQALQQYVDFYECIRAHKDEVVIANFTSITRDYAKVMAALNYKYQKNYLPYQNSPTADKAIFAEIDRLNLDNEHGKTNQLARPSEEKRADLDKARTLIEANPLASQAIGIFKAIEPVCV